MSLTPVPDPVPVDLDPVRIAGLLIDAADQLSREEVEYALGLHEDHISASTWEIVTDKAGAEHIIEVPRDLEEADREMADDIAAHEAYVADLRATAYALTEGLPLFDRVVLRLKGENVAATVEYPGVVVITVDETEQVATGQNGWDYGSVSHLEDGEWQPVDGVDAAPEGLRADETDPALIAQAWGLWTRKRRIDRTPIPRR